MTPPAPRATASSEPLCLVEPQQPFSRMILLDYYDGPTGGVVQRSRSRRVYRFDMLDWDDNHHIRIFRLAELPPEAIEECVAVFAPAVPRWPVWSPWPHGVTEAFFDEMETQLHAIFARSRPAELLVAWVGCGEEIVAARRIYPSELAHEPDWLAGGWTEARDWFAALRLTRGIARAEPNDLRG
jgi:hypothetical protein